MEGQARSAEAERDDRALVPVLEERARRFPEPAYLAELAAGHYEWALVLRQRGQGEEADRQLPRAVARQREVLAKQSQDACRHRALCVYQLAAGDHRGAADSVRAWVRAAPAGGRPRYHEAAWCLAGCAARAGQDGEDAEGLAREAVALLRRAAGQKAVDADFLARKEFDALRDRDDFKEVLRSLGKPK